MKYEDSPIEWRIECYLRQLAPHAKNREAGKLLAEALTENQRLRAIVNNIKPLEGSK